MPKHDSDHSAVIFGHMQPAWAVRYGLMAVIWTVLIGISAAWVYQLVKENTLDVARAAARANINKDISFRKWAAMHGGVYVPPTQHTQPNPYLVVPERDITTTKGMALTLMNPAFMLRQMQTDFPGEFGTRSRITSLLPLNPANAPDPWETRALQSFERGGRELLEPQQIDGQPYLRMMLPFFVDGTCLKCHAHQGYKVGDVRGGIGTAILLTPFLARERDILRGTMVSHGAIWLLGLTGLSFGYRRDRRLSAERQAAANALRKSEERHRDRLEEEVKLRTAELQAVNADLEGFSYSVSHDLRSPLRAIDGFAAILREDYAPRLDAEGLRLLNVVSDNAQQMERLIDDILAFSRAGRRELKAESVDMNALVDEVWQSLAPQRADRAIELRRTELPAARGDQAAIRQIWQNLLSNAVKFTRGRTPAVIEVGGERLGAESLYWVKDNGAGFDAAYVDKLFGLFQRLHGITEYEGTGVGLAVVKRFVQKHGGRVEAEGRVGEGAVFRFTLPANA